MQSSCCQRKLIFQGVFHGLACFQLDDLLGSFNAEVLALRHRKAELRDHMAAQEARLRSMHREVPPHLRVDAPEPPAGDAATEYPERMFQVSRQKTSVTPSEILWRYASLLRKQQPAHHGAPGTDGRQPQRHGST